MISKSHFTASKFEDDFDEEFEETENQKVTIHDEIKNNQESSKKEYQESQEYNESESQIENEIFNMDCVGIDVSVDTETLEQFEYEESINMDDL